MNLLLRWKLIGYIIALFGAGIAVGELLPRPLFPAHAPTADHHMNIAEMLRHKLKTKLDLTPDQQAQIEPLVQAASLKFQAIHDESYRQTEEASKELDAQIRPLLTPDQQGKLCAWEHERSENLRSRLHNAPAVIPPKTP